MAVRLFFSISISLEILTSCLVQSASAAPTALESGVSQLLDLGQRYSPRALTEARKQHDRLSQLPDYDARVQYAFALVLIKQRSSDEALAALDAVLADRPALLPAWRAKVWMQMSARKYAAAIHSMRAAAVAMAEQAKKPPARAATDSEADERAETARFFGRVFGFLEGPRGHAIAAEELRKSKQYVQSRLGDDRAAFSEGEESISAQLVKLRERQVMSESAAAAHLADREAAVKQQQKKVDEAEADVDFKAEKLQTDTKAQLEELSKRAESIQKNILPLQFRLNGVDQAIALQQGQATIQNASLNQPGTIDANVRVAAIRQLNLIQNNLQQLAIQRSALAMQIGVLSDQLVAAVAERDSLLGYKEQTTGELKSRAGQLKRKEKELDRAQKAAAKGQTGTDTRALAQQQAFGTYEPFPFELEKERVLKWFQR